MIVNDKIGYIYIYYTFMIYLFINFFDISLLHGLRDFANCHKSPKIYPIYLLKKKIHV